MKTYTSALEASLNGFISNKTMTAYNQYNETGSAIFCITDLLNDFCDQYGYTYTSQLRRKFKTVLERYVWSEFGYKMNVQIVR